MTDLPRFRYCWILRPRAAFGIWFFFTRHRDLKASGEGQAPGPAPPLWLGWRGHLAELHLGGVPFAHSGTECPAGLQPPKGPQLQMSIANTPNPTDPAPPAALWGALASGITPRGLAVWNASISFLLLTIHTASCPVIPVSLPDGILSLGGPRSWHGQTLQVPGLSSCSHSSPVHPRRALPGLRLGIQPRLLTQWNHVLPRVPGHLPWVLTPAVSRGLSPQVAVRDPAPACLP